MRTSVAWRLAAVAAALAVSVLPVLTGSAHAKGKEDCTEGNFCVWSGPHFEDQFRQAPGRATKCFRPEIAWNDGARSRVRSFYNKSRFQYEAFTNDACSGAPATILTNGHSVEDIESEVKSFRMAPVCEQGAVCFYEGENYTGQMVQNSSWNYGFCTGSGIVAKSVYNATDRTASLFDTNGNCQNARAVDLPSRSYQSYDTTFYGFRVKPRD